MKKGFTLIEMLVASLLMGMLVTILTMVFNASSIAWRTGRASLVDLDETRRDAAKLQRLADNALYDKANNKLLFVRSAWDDTATSVGVGKSLQKRAVVDDKTLRRRGWFGTSDFADSKPPWKNVENGVNAGTAADTEFTYTVGVMSYGPDGKTGAPGSADAADDITSWPEGVQ